MESTNSLTSSQSRSVSTNSSPKAPSKKRSSSSFIKKLGSRLRSNSQSNEGRQLNSSFSNNTSNKYGSLSSDQDTTFTAYTKSRPTSATIGTQTPIIMRRSTVTMNKQPTMNSNDTSISNERRESNLVNQNKLDLDGKL